MIACWLAWSAARSRAAARNSAEVADQAATAAKSSRCRSYSSTSEYAISRRQVALGELTIEVDRAEIVPTLEFLRDDPQCRFVCFIDLCGADYPVREKRFDVVYHLLSPTLNERIRVRAEADETTQVPSIIDVFPGADWFERETYDLYGVLFSGHPDTRERLAALTALQPGPPPAPRTSPACGERNRDIPRGEGRS